MKPGDLACHLTRNLSPVLLLRKILPNLTESDTWVVILNGKEEIVWSDNLVLWEDRERENVRETQKE